MRMTRMRKKKRMKMDEEREREREEEKKRGKRGEKGRLKETMRWSAAPELHPEAVRGRARSGRIGHGQDVMHS